MRIDDITENILYFCFVALNIIIYLHTLFTFSVLKNFLCHEDDDWIWVYSKFTRRQFHGQIVVSVCEYALCVLGNCLVFHWRFTFIKWFELNNSDCLLCCRFSFFILNIGYPWASHANWWMLRVRIFYVCVCVYLDAFFSCWEGFFFYFNYMSVSVCLSVWLLI